MANQRVPYNIGFLDNRDQKHVENELVTTNGMHSTSVTLEIVKHKLLHSRHTDHGNCDL